jgi:hypothetical protein
MKALFVSLIIAVLVGFVIFRRPTFMEQLALELGCNDRKALARATADMQRQVLVLPEFWAGMAGWCRVVRRSAVRFTKWF